MQKKYILKQQFDGFFCINTDGSHMGHFARECRIKGNQDNRRRDAWNSGNKDGSRTGKKEDSKALVTIDGEGVDWTNHLLKMRLSFDGFATVKIRSQR
ncbi:hypothetical protein Tco_0158628 [Tanacetum coccineum]